MKHTSSILSWLAATVSLVGFILCLALPCYSVTIESTEGRMEVDVFVWSSGSFTVSWHVWAMLASFLVGAFASRVFANHQKANGVALSVVGIVTLAAIAISFLASDGGTTIPQIRSQRRMALPLTAAGAAILLIFVAIELFRTAETRRSAPENANP